MKQKLIFGLCAALIIVGIVLYVFNRAEPVSIDKPINAILQLNEKEKQDAIAKAEKSFSDAEKIKLSSEAEKAILKAQIAALKAKLALPMPTVGPSVPLEPIPAPSEALSISLDVIKKQDILIGTLESDLKKALAQGTQYKLSAEQFKAALQVSQRNEAVLRIAKDAQIEAIKSSRWRGRKEGALSALLLDLGLRIATR